MTASRRPLVAPPGDLEEVAAEAWVAVEEWTSDTDWTRFLARYGTALVWLDLVAKKIG